MKKFFLYVIAQIAALGIATYFLTGLKINGGLWTYVGLAIAIALINILVRPVIKFLTLPINFLTFGLFNLIVSVALLYLLKFIFPINFISGEFQTINVANLIVLNPIRMDGLGTLIATSFLMSLLSAFIEILI